MLMTIYVEPIFEGGRFAGVLGMGVNYQVIIDRVSNISAYDSGYAFLTDAEGNVMYHPAIAYGTNLSDDDEEVPAVDEAIAAGTTTEDVVVYRYHGADKRMAFHLLQNDMRLVLSVDAREIYADRDRLVQRLVIVTGISLVLLVVTAYLGAKRALRPLTQLTQAAERVAAGDLSVSLPKTDAKEIKGLVSAYETTVGELRGQIDYIHLLAHTDALTGFRNKGSFEEDAQALNARIATGEDLRLSVAMLDVNDLKPINDTYGHEAGDVLIQGAAALIAQTFPEATLYRTGGDEFVALLEGDLPDLHLIAEKNISIACGVATYRAVQDATVGGVLARADERMYAHKREQKRQSPNE